MKNLIACLFLCLGFDAASAAPPAPAGFGQVPNLTNGFWLTNITFVYTNAAICTPFIDLSQVTIYDTNTIKGTTLLAWQPPTNGPPAGYKVYYGPLNGSTTNIFTVNSNVTVAVFFTVLTNGIPWWAFATAFDGLGIESDPSASITFTPPIH